jgi:Protein of unknown function (DUF2997)
MRREEITVTITPDGRATVAVKGVGGPQCEELTAELEQALGLLQKRRQRTNQYYEVQQAGMTSIRRA